MSRTGESASIPRAFSPAVLGFAVSCIGRVRSAGTLLSRANPEKEPELWYIFLWCGRRSQVACSGSDTSIIADAVMVLTGYTVFEGNVLSRPRQQM